MKYKRLIPLAIIASALLAPLASAKDADVPAPKNAVPAKSTPLSTPERVTSVEGITEYRMNNGLRILLFPDASKPTVTHCNCH